MYSWPNLACLAIHSRFGAAQFLILACFKVDNNYINIHEWPVSPVKLLWVAKLYYSMILVEPFIFSLILNMWLRVGTEESEALATCILLCKACIPYLVTLRWKQWNIIHVHTLYIVVIWDWWENRDNKSAPISQIILQFNHIEMNSMPTCYNLYWCFMNTMLSCPHLDCGIDSECTHI